ncbi:I78 family peptidase inhibitor [Pseudomonas sp. GOM7]|uniref:I78 family peptidase inhibitor n=1 Tax=unclassified Pseudomonas TaxID=196821 RepID=UPI00227B4C81|nr:MULTISPECIES: I78 family peptidase inhibitor [unclassified Pseudomonas]WAJ40031.1 I78 family peptidase inhibitor [Pseudomonas sp. GOM7]
MLTATLLASGCSSTAEKPASAAAPSGSTHDSCTSSAAEHFKGQSASPELLEQARQEAGASSARILTPRSVVTLEYNGQRLNLNVDEQGVITRVSCG